MSYNISTGLAAKNTSTECDLLTKVAIQIREPLSIREIQVLSLWLLGHTMSKIGQRLFISPRTVETHMNHVRDKIRLKRREDIIRYLITVELYDDLLSLAKQLMA